MAGTEARRRVSGPRTMFSPAHGTDRRRPPPKARANYGGPVSTSPDIAVIGGGIAGASVAHELAATRSVVLLEAEPEPGTHSTARSAATWIPGHGVATVRALITASGPRLARFAAQL